MLLGRLDFQGQPGMCVQGHNAWYPLLGGDGQALDLMAVINLGDELAATVKRALTGAPIGAPHWLPAVPAGSKIICVGTNYRRHLEEVGLPLPQEPVLFSKFSNALAAHGEAIQLPAVAHQCDYEAELALIIGRGGKHIAQRDALNHVFAITCANDLSARDLQFRSSQWLLGKTPDGFCPLGPAMRTLDGIDPDNLTIRLTLNGQPRQQANTGKMIFGCAQLIHYIAQTITLSPGDVILTGTPEGVIQGYPEDRRRWLQPGDEMEVMIEGLPPLRNIIA